jgi:two-component system chemotaxis sensor kinase CheA
MYEHNPEETNEELREMLGSFVSEAFESLDSNEQLIEYLSEEDNSDHVNAIFRAFHTIKGLSGFFGMKVINSVTHVAETLLDKIRKQGKPQNEEIINIIYMTFDLIRDLLNKVSIDFTDKEGEDEAENICLLIKDAIDKVDSEKTGEGSASVENIPEEAKPPEAEKAVQEKKVIDVTKDTEGDDEFLTQFISDSTDLLELIMNNLIKMESGESDKALLNETFGAVHSLKGTAGFMSLGQIEEQAFDMETILDSIRAGELELNETIISVLLSNAEIISGMIGKLRDKNEPAAERRHDEEKQVKIELDENKADTDQAEKAESKEPPKDKTAQKTAKPKPAAQVKKDIRVETSKIDKLFDMVGELITIESMVTNNPDLKGLELPNFQKSANLLSKITREIQEITMSVRMMPLEGLFNKMKRLVRDVSVKMDKKVNLLVSGQETEMDKNVIDEISDPLVHILRNSVDHGIEVPEKRSAAGKDETGTVKLSAGYEGNEIVISVIDDGKGIDREKIIQKALSRGLIEGNPEELTDKEVNLLILEPGFSTADEITDISGRGVGMDVVKKKYRKTSREN